MVEDVSVYFVMCVLYIQCFNISASNELVFINFYADWCRFSNLLAPIFDEAADKITAEFPTPGQVVMGKVDCDKESKWHIIYSCV